MRVTPKRIFSAFQLQGHCYGVSFYYSQFFIVVRLVGIRETTL